MYSKITCMTVNVYFRSCCWRLLDEITGWAVTACYYGGCYYEDCYYGDCYTVIVSVSFSLHFEQKLFLCSGEHIRLLDTLLYF